MCTLRSPKMFDVALIHWREDVIVLGQERPAVRGIVAYFLSMLLYRVVSRRVVYVRHNDYPHKVLPRYQDQIATQLVNSNGVIIVNDPGSMIVSGTFFFALSSGAPVFARNNAFYDWVAATSLKEFLHTFDSVSELASHVAATGDRSDAEPGAVKAEAARYFGDQTVLDAWKSLFEQIGAWAMLPGEKPDA